MSTFNYILNMFQMVIESPLEVQRVEGKECRDDPDTAEKKQKMVDDRLYVLRKAATRNPEGFRVSFFSLVKVATLCDLKFILTLCNTLENIGVIR